jgi:hypothetical protein
MSKCYSSGTAPSQAGTGPLTACTILSTALIRSMVNEIIGGISTTPADQTYQLCATRCTTAGTAASNPTALPLDPSDVPAISIVGITHSAEPTYTAASDLLDIYLNQRATFRWVAQDGRELVGPATANNGIGARMKLASASSTLHVTVLFRE